MDRTSVECVGEYEYDNKERLGFGAFAIVFKGWYKKKPKKEVAIKSIAKKNLAKSQSLLDKEIKILRELTLLEHENVVALLECIDHPTHVFLVMEFCNGGDLQDYLVVQKTLSENTIRLFAQQLADAMQALYAKGILHRDLKPQNILLKYDKKYECGEKLRKKYPRPEEITLKIADFGFARFLSDGVMAATMCGSPMYMAPEVIMSLRYDAKADLWSLGTILYQCLAGSAPFTATTPAGLKQIYEKNSNLKPNFPKGTSEELKDLLTSLLKRNSADRISFEDFFQHAFLRPPPALIRPRPLASPPREISRERRHIFNDLVADENRSQCLYDITSLDKTLEPPHQPPPPIPIGYNNGNTYSASPSDSSDDFVFVPSNLPTDASCGNSHNSSQTRPSSLAVQVNYSSERKTNSPNERNVNISKTEPIKIQRPRSESTTTDITSISPPSVQFVLGTPPLGRRPPDSPPNGNNWVLASYCGAPFHKSVTSSPLLTSPFSGPSVNSKVALNSRAITLPELKTVGTAMGFIFPELNEGKRFRREHTEILTKLNFLMVLVECILECANPSRDRSERLVLLVRALQLLSCGLTLATNELNSGHLQPTKNVKNVAKQLNEKFHKCLEDSKKLNVPSVLQKVAAPAEKILYNYAIEMCQKAALNELQCNFTECFKRYQMAQILLHALSQQINNTRDKALLCKYRSAVEKRLALLQDRQQFTIEPDFYQFDTTNESI